MVKHNKKAKNMTKTLSKLVINFVESKKWGEDEYFRHSVILEGDKVLSQDELDKAVSKFNKVKEKMVEDLFNGINDGSYGELFDFITDEIEKMGYKIYELPTLSETIETMYTLA